MDLNVLPPEEEDYFEYVEEDNASHKSSHVFTQKNKNSIHVEHTETAVEIARREREERKQKLKRERNDDRPTHATKQATHDNDYQKSSRSYDTTKLPSGWLECPPMGDVIYGFLPSKVPLGEDFNNCIPPGKRYSFKQVSTRARLMGRRIGMVIDLTNTSRYYKDSDLSPLTKDCITYVKIPCRGRDSVPDNESVNRFVYEVSQFFSRQKKQPIQLRKHIFVHCTHGHNRTGFMIVHYLVRMKSYPVKEAIEIFAKARIPGIYKPDYIKALYTFYHEIRRKSFPQTPEWKRSSDLDLNSDAVPDDDNDDCDGTVPVQEDNHEISLVMTNDDVLGDNIPDDQQYALREFCYKMLMLPIGPKGVSQFPGSNPVSLDRDNLQLLRQRYYYATWKADGTRYMMLITFDGCYLIDRSFNFRRVQMRFPCRSTKEGGWNKTHHYTLLDGEMIIDKGQDSGKHERRYLIYDMMATNGHSIVQIPFSQRWELLEKEIIEPRNHERTSKNCLYKYDMELFRVRRKDFWPLSTVKKLLKEFNRKLSHEADGLIFQCWDDQYICRTHQGLLKWKYAQMNSVDFLFEIVDERWLIYCFERGKKKLIRGTVQFKGDIDPVSCMGKIIECSLDSEKKVWIYMRTRRDKSTPNDINTYRKVLQSINDNITEDVLMMEIDDVIGLPMYAERFKELTKKPMHQVHRDVGEGRS